MFLTLLTTLKSKYLIFALILAGVLAYYNIQIMSYKNDILDYKSNISELNIKYTDISNKRDLLEFQLDNLITTNSKNILKCKSYRYHTQDTISQYKEQINNKSKQINRLISTINRLRSLPKPKTKSTIVVKDCKIYKGASDEYLQKLSNIGR